MQHIGHILTGPARPTPCDHTAAFLARNGCREQFGAWCDACSSWATVSAGWHVGLWLPKDHARLVGIDLDHVPVRPVAFYRMCQHCREFQSCELHHFAPRAFFSDACDDWPVAYLCKPCHDEWHTRVTPGLCTAYDADVHAKMLFDYLGVVNARALFVAIRQEGERRKAA